MSRYWVVGGEYTDTRFAQLAGGKSEEWIGPFVDYQAAKKEWAKRAWSTVDSCHVRYRIEKHNDEDPPCSD